MAENNALGRLMTIQYIYIYIYTLTSEQLGGGEAIMLQSKAYMWYNLLPKNQFLRK